LTILGLRAILGAGGTVSYSQRDIAAPAADTRFGAISAARIARSTVELDRLRTEHKTWLDHRCAPPGPEQHGTPDAQRYETQLTAVSALVENGVEQLVAVLGSLDPALSEGAVYEACRTSDLRLLWLRRVWDFFREKFDQRDGDLADTLRAADEVVWSCYRQVFDRARQIAPQLTAGPAPLPFIEPRYAPSTFPADLVPAGLQSEIDRPFLREHLNRLPIPVVRLQPACVSGPWWLVYAAHEVGHNVQYDLLEGQAMVGQYQELVGNAVRTAGGDAADVVRWRRWAREIFADIYSVFMTGPWAVWAITDLELQTDSAMLRRRELYPSAVVRLALLAATAGALRLDTRFALRGIEPQRIATRSGEVSRDMEFVGPVVRASLGPLPSIGVTLARLCHFQAADFQPAGVGQRTRVDTLRGELAGAAELDRAADGDGSLGGPRLAVSASLAAWSAVMTTADDAERERLAARSRSLIRRSGPPGKRASRTPADLTGVAADVVSSLLAAGPDELETWS
jgi:hypothetical protein